MRLSRLTVSLMLFGLPLFAVGGQSSAVSLHSALGLGVYTAHAPYETGLAATVRLGFAVPLSQTFALALDGHLMGSGMTADAYGPTNHPLPNTTGASVSLVRTGEGHQRFAFEAGAGVYHVARRTNAPGGSGAGLHVGTSAVLARGSHVALTANARALLLPSIGGGRVLFVPLGLGIVAR